MPNVEFIYDQECPNVDRTRSNLIKAFSKANLSPKWTEWDRNSADSPEYARKYGSPTILVDGKDITGGGPESGNNCRIYTIGSSEPGVPAVEMIAAKLKEKNVKPMSSLRLGIAAIPGIGIVLLPKLTCAACWPAYAAIMSSLGVGFFNYSEYLFPITLTALMITLIALAYRAKNRRGFGPLYLGLFASLLTALGKFSMESDPVFYFGVVLLVISSFWNSWPKKVDLQGCSACES